MTQAYDVPKHQILMARDAKVHEPEQDKGFGAEVFHRLYSEEPREMPAVPGNASRRKVHGLVSEIPEFQALKSVTENDPEWAAMAASTLTEKVGHVLPKSGSAEAQHALEALEDMRDVVGENAQIEQAIADAQAALEAAHAADEASAQAIDESAVRGALRAAIAESSSEIQETREALATLGGGNGGGNSAGRVSPNVAKELARRIKNSPKLKDILAMAGKLISTARAKRAQRTEYARSEVVGVEQTNHVERLLTSELALFADATLTDDLLIRLTERRAGGFKLHGKEKLAKGPIVMMLDQSGSMESGTKDVWAKAIALALYDTARQDKRDFTLITYASNVIAVTPITGPESMLDAVSGYPSGGTDYTSAMVQALAVASDKSDIVHITDGETWDQTQADRLLAMARDKHTTVYGIAIQASPGNLARWCDNVTAIDDVSKDTPVMDRLFGEGGI